MSSDKIADLRELGFADPVKMVTSFPEIAGLASDNVRRKIADLRELGFADPVKMITYLSANPGPRHRQHPRQDSRPARARFLRPGEDGHVKPINPGPWH